MARRVSDEIRKRSPLGAAAFFCECSDACFHVVWLDVLDYDLAILTPNSKLFAGGYGAFTLGVRGDLGGRRAELVSSTA